MTCESLFGKRGVVQMARMPRLGGVVTVKKSMCYFVYILKSKSQDWYYIGYTKDLKDRLKRHNGGREKATQHRKPYKVVYLEEFETKTDAMRREKEIKSYKGGNAFKKLLAVR